MYIGNFLFRPLHHLENFGRSSAPGRVLLVALQQQTQILFFAEARLTLPGGTRSANIPGSRIPFELFELFYLRRTDFAELFILLFFPPSFHVRFSPNTSRFSRHCRGSLVFHFYIFFILRNFFRIYNIIFYLNSLFS